MIQRYHEIGNVSLYVEKLAFQGRRTQDSGRKALFQNHFLKGEIYLKFLIGIIKFMME
jgi:hypothetical protein